MEKIRQLFLKYRSVILYIFFGGCTTLVNILVYAVCSRIFKMDTVSGTVIAWIVAVTFAFITNRKMVFESNATHANEILRETLSFFSCRLLTGGLDLLIMYVFVDVTGFNDLVMKAISNIIVIILNYIASKLLIFKHGGQNGQEI